MRPRLPQLVFLALVWVGSLSGLAVARELVAGRVVETNIQFPPVDRADLFPDNVVWTKRFDAPQVSRPRFGQSRLLLTDIELHGPGEVSIEIANAFGRVLETLPRGQLDRLDEFWTTGSFGGGISIRVVGAEASKILSFRIAALAYDLDGIVLEQIYGENGLVAVALYDGALKPVVAGVQTAVARLAYRDAGAKKDCSGFLLGGDLFVTNNHCIHDAAQCPSAEAWFGYQESAAGSVSFGKGYKCIDYIGGDATLDIAVLRLAGQPSETWPPLRIATPPAVAAGDVLLLVQHPAGEAKQVSAAECGAIARDVEVETEFGHSCDTKDGSSGSPVVNQYGELVGLHRAGHSGNPGDTIPNIAVRWTSIAAWLQENLPLP